MKIVRTPPKPAARSAEEVQGTTTTASASASASASVSKSASASTANIPFAPAIAHAVSTTPAAAREIAVHARELGVMVEGRAMSDVIADIQAAELALGQKHDARVASEDMARAARWSEQAAKMTPAKQSGLFGFTRVVDAKLELGTGTINALAHACDRDVLLQMINDGPGNGDIAWAKPSSKEELVASLVRQVALGAGASKQIALEPSLAKWLDTTLAAGGITTKKAMGGAGAFAANLAAAIGVTAKFFSKDKLPDAIADRFSRLVKVVTGQGETTSTRKHSDEAVARTNTAAEYTAGQPLSLFGEDALTINGKQTKLSPGGTGRVIMGTQAKDVVPGFAGVARAAIEKMARSTDMFFFVGAHYLTQGSADDASKAAAQLGADLDVMKRANPTLVRHMQYVVPKVAANEPVVLQALKGHVDSLALNSVEMAPLMDALHDAGMSKFDVDRNLPREAAEDPAHMLEGALALVDAMSLSRAHLHGFEGDLVVSKAGTPGHADPERQKLALLKARQLASNKAANDTGEIKSAEDIWPVVPSVRGQGLAALHRFADAVQARYGLSERERELVVERWWFKDPASDAVIHFVPSRGIHDRSGGTVSLGDTIDSSALMFAMPERTTKARTLMHGSSFTER